MPTIQQCLDHYGEKKFYVQSGFDRFKNDNYVLGMPTSDWETLLNSYRVTPIISDPTNVDSDGDELLDNEDPFKLIYNTHSIYNRDKAIEYALKWTNEKVNVWENYNHQYYFYNENNGNCVNFVSQCLVAGEIPMTDEWHSYRYDIEGVQNVINNIINGVMGEQFLDGRYYTQMYEWDVTTSFNRMKEFRAYFDSPYFVEKTLKLSSIEDIESAVKEGLISVGDIMIIDNLDGGEYNHATIISSVNDENLSFGYCGHTRIRNDMDIKDLTYKEDWINLHILKIRKKIIND